MRTTLLSLLLVVAASFAGSREAASAPDSEELHAAANAVGEFMLTLYSNDGAGNQRTIVPHPEGASLVKRAKLPPDELARVREDVAALALGQEEPFQCRGRAAKPDGNGQYPVDTSGLFVTQFRGVQMAIPVVKTAAGWKVDVRYWVAMQKPYDETAPEVVARKFLYLLIAHKADELKDVAVTGSNLSRLLSRKAPGEDVYYALALEMPVADARDGDGMTLANGTVVETQRSSDTCKWLTGLYGHQTLVFELRREPAGWRVVPRDYLSLIGLGARPPARSREFARVGVTLPPPVTRPAPPRVSPPAPPPVTSPAPLPEATAGPAATPGPDLNGIRTGATQEEVQQAIGSPKGQFASGALTIWSYPTGMIEFRRGKVESIKSVSTRPVAPATPAPARDPVRPRDPEMVADNREPIGPGEAGRALDRIMRDVCNVDDVGLLARYVDWNSVYRATDRALLQALDAKSPTELRDLCLMALRTPSELVRRPLRKLIAAAPPEDRAIVDRLAAALARADERMRPELELALSEWKDMRYELGGETIEGSRAVVTLKVMHGRDQAEREVRMVKVGNECLLEATWLPEMLKDTAEEIHSKGDGTGAVAAAVKELRAAADRRAGR